MSKIGFIGLGIMGKPMSKNLVKAGHELVVNDHKDSAMQELVDTGSAKAAKTAAEVAAECDIIMTMLPNSPHVKEVVLGEGGIIETVREGSLVIDMSSIDPTVSKELAAALREKGVGFVDAPVSGGEPKAIDGTLAFMVGASEADFQRAEPLLKCMGASVVRCGEVGAGNVTKLANQIIVALNIAALGEALVLATKAGVDPAAVFEAIRGGLAGSTVMEAKAPLMLDRKFDPGFRIELHIKDLANALAAGHAVGSPLPLTAQVMEIAQALKVDGLGKADHGALVRYFEKLAQVEVKRA